MGYFLGNIHIYCPPILLQFFRIEFLPAHVLNAQFLKSLLIINTGTRYIGFLHILVTYCK